MAKGNPIGYRIVAAVVGQKGHCALGHKLGDVLEVNCEDSGGLCGFFYNRIFADLQTFQFGGRLPWWKGDVIEVECADLKNMITLRLERFKRE